MRFSFSILLIISFLFVIGQNDVPSGKKAQKLYEQAQNAFKKDEIINALDFLDKLIEEEPGFLESYLLKSDILMELDSFDCQLKVLEQAIRIDPQKYPKLFYVFGKAAYKAGYYEKADSAYNQYLLVAGEDATFASLCSEEIKKCRNAIKLVTHPVPFIVEDIGPAINTIYDEYWPSLTLDGHTLIFTRLTPYMVMNISGREVFQEDFYTSSFVNGEWQISLPLNSINSTYNEGAQTVSADGKLLFYTACTRSDGWGSCDLYYSRMKNGVWSEPHNAGEPVNTTSWESQPSISANGRCLFFVSNRSGGKGGMDIWKCEMDGFSKWGTPVWGKPVNLGDSINTPGNEMSPFIHPDGRTLYFASDNWPGLGGYDIFYSRLVNDSTWSKPKNIGYPINSNKDEQGMIVDAKGKRAYYSSDRQGSKGMDIYSFALYKAAQPNPVSYIKGKVKDKASGKPLCAAVELIDLSNSKTVIKGESCWEKGEFLTCLPLGREFAFNVSREGYLFYSQNFALKKVKDAVDPYLLEIELQPIEVGNSTVLRNVFFRTASYELLDESKTELQKLIDFLHNNPNILIEIGGHTDNVGSVEFNMELSKQRAKTVYTYLVDHGINESRLSYKGYGYSLPIATNETVEGRASNRRTEFKIVQK